MFLWLILILVVYSLMPAAYYFTKFEFIANLAVLIFLSDCVLLLGENIFFVELIIYYRKGVWEYIQSHQITVHDYITITLEEQPTNLTSII